MDNFSKLVELNHKLFDINKGDIIEGIIKSKFNHFLLVDLGLKSYVFYPLKLESSTSFYKVGNKILFYVDQISSLDGELILNHIKAYKLIQFKNIWNLLIQNKEFINGVILNHVSGGYSVGINGLVAFLPNNQIFSIKYPNYLIGTRKTFSIINVNLYKKNLVISRIYALERSV